MATTHSNSSLVVAAGGVFAYVILVSGIWHPKVSKGGLTQVDRHASISYEDGSVLELTESETDLDTLRKRRLSRLHGRGYGQTFIMADGSEMEVFNNRSGFDEDSDLSSGSHLILAANSRLTSEEEVPPPLDRGDTLLASLQVDGKDQVVKAEVDGKDRVVTQDMVDAKDRISLPDPKDAKDAPVFALSTQPESPELSLLGPDGVFGNLRTTTPSFNTPTGSITGPPIGGAVPEPSTWTLLGVAGATAGAIGFGRRRQAA